VENARISYAYLLKESKRRGMDDIVEFLEERGCPPWDSISDILYMMRCSELVFGAFADIPEELITERTEFESVPSQEWVKRRLALSSRIWNELKSADITGLLPHIQTPMLMALGEVDYFVPPMAVEIGFDIYGGYKEKVLFPGTKHLVYRGCEAPFLDRVTRFLDQPFESPNRIQRSA
jgi:pimeloyl-ACP methyl ester carboxylesterase